MFQRTSTPHHRGSDVWQRAGGIARGVQIGENNVLERKEQKKVVNDLGLSDVCSAKSLALQSSCSCMLCRLIVVLHWLLHVTIFVALHLVNCPRPPEPV